MKAKKILIILLFISILGIILLGASVLTSDRLESLPTGEVSVDNKTACSRIVKALNRSSRINGTNDIPSVCFNSSTEEPIIDELSGFKPGDEFKKTQDGWVKADE